MTGLKIAIAVMTTLIVVGIAVIGVTIARRLSSLPAGTSAPISLDQPAGTHIVSLASTPDRLAVLVQGGGPDRILLLDPKTFKQLGEVQVSH